MNDERQSVGERGETLAARHLEEQGWEVVERNFSTKLGEIDIIARRKDPHGDAVLIAFVEVKTRTDDGGPPPEASITWTKRRKLAALGQLWLQKNYQREVMARFDVVAVDLRGSQPQIRHYEAAFDALGRLS